MQRLSRRHFAGGSVGFGIGAFTAGVAARATAQQATPAVVTTSPVSAEEQLGYVSLRLRELGAPELVQEVDQIVIAEFIPEIQVLPGYQGYLLGDVIENRSQNLSIVVFQNELETEAFDAAARDFVGGLDPQYIPETPVQAEGGLLVAAAPSASSGTPAVATPLAGTVPAMSSGYVAVSIYPGTPGTDPREIAPLVVAGFLPIVSGLPGFSGYLLFPSEGGFTSISLFESETSARESTTAEETWTRDNLATYTEGNPMVITADIAYAALPVLANAGA